MGMEGLLFYQEKFGLYFFSGGAQRKIKQLHIILGFLY
jgi:hypothetical protein